MRCALLFLATVFLSTSAPAQQESVAGGTAQGGAGATANEKLVKGVFAATDPAEATVAYHRLFTQIGFDGVRGLQTSPNDSIAIQAAWEEVALTVPEKEGKNQYRPDRHKLDWFLGFLEGRARVQAPEWWRESLFNAGANHRHNFYFGLPENPPGTSVKSPYHDAGLDDVTAPLDTTLSRKGGKIVLLVGRESVTIPEKLFTDYECVDGRLRCGVSALVTPSRCYIAVHGVIGDYQLTCIDRASSRVLWTNSVWGAFSGGLTGYAEQWVTVTEQHDRIVVFGCVLGINIEGFRSDSGANLFRFSNIYSDWEDRGDSGGKEKPKAAIVKEKKGASPIEAR